MQTVHFQLKDGLAHSIAIDAVKKEYEQYKRQLEQSGTKYQILDETIQPDGSIIIPVSYTHLCLSSDL